MNSSILQFVEQMQGQILTDLVVYDHADLYEIAKDIIQKEDETQFHNICQAYEVVKHNLIG